MANDADDKRLLFRMDRGMQLEQSILETRASMAAAQEAGSWTALASLRRHHDKLLTDLHEYQEHAPKIRAGQPPGGMEMNADEVVAYMLESLQDLPSHVVDAVGEAVDRLRRVEPVRLRVVPGSRRE